MLDTLVSSKTRIKLLLRFFLNPYNRSYLRQLSEEFGESTNAVRVELNRFEHAGMLNIENEGNKKLYKANPSHPLFKDINNILLKYIGADKIIESLINRMGNLEKLYLSGDYARGRDSGIIDLVLIGDVDKSFLADKVAKAEDLIGKKIRYLLYNTFEWSQQYEGIEVTDVLLWQKNEAVDDRNEISA